eukprot:scaffold20.g7838.t1
MYPTVGVFSPPARQQEQQAPEREQRNAQFSRASTSGILPTLQVHIAPPFRVAPPVPVPSLPPGGDAAVPGAAGQRPAFDFEVERRVLAEAEAASTSGANGGGANSSNGPLGPQQLDPLEATLQQYAAMGYGREEAALALAVARAAGRADDDAAVQEACGKVRTLMDMRFPREVILGALASCGGSLEEAIDACLAVTST